MDWLNNFIYGEGNDKEAEIAAYIEKNYVEKNVFDEETEKLRREIENVRKEAEVEREIEKNGGKNVKAIKALIEEGDIEVDEKGKIIINLKRIMEEAPYLFREKKEGIEGTGIFMGKEKKKKSIIDYARKGAGLE